MKRAHKFNAKRTNGYASALVALYVGSYLGERDR